MSFGDSALPVQNFLEDEEYESESTASSVPDFLQDEEYESADGGEYYGGGFAEGAAAGAVEDGFFGSYGDEDDLEETGEEELFEGGELFEDDAEADGQTAESSPYGISGVSFRPSGTATPSATRGDSGSASGGEAAPVRRVDTPVVTISSPGSTVDLPTEAALTTGGTTTDGTVSTGKSTTPTTLFPNGDSGSTSSVPNFLEDEDDELSPTSGSAPSEFGGATPYPVPLESAPARPRRDLSKRPQQDRVPAPSAPTPSAGPVAAERTTPSTTPQRESSAGSQRANPIPGARLSPTVAVAFEPGAATEAPTERELTELKSPSSYAAKRESRFTALKQSDATVRKVGADGLTSAERGRAARTTLPSQIRTPSTGKLSEEEILFYANLGAKRSGDYGSDSKKELFLPPALAESAEQRREREARINRALAAGSVARGTRSRLTEKDYRVLRFIALFKFSSERQIAKLLQVGEHSAYKRLNELRKHGLTKGFKTLGVKGSVWMLTETGMDLSGFELPRGTEAALTLSMVSHQFTVNHVAAHLWSGGANVLREKNFPQRNLPDGSGGFGFGEQLISELQIQSAFGKVRGSSKADAYVPQIKKHLANQFDNWQRAGGVEFGPSPELQRGNEYMWTLFPPISNRLNYHVPDLVVARPRSADGKPQSIAVEVELKTKADDSSYERTLDAYRSDDSIYRKVVWICRLKGTAEKLTRIAQRNGLADQGRIAIVPIYLEDGSRFTGKDTWSL